MIRSKKNGMAAISTFSESLKGRDLKVMLRDLLRQYGPEKALEKTCHLPARQVANPLFSFLYSTDPLFRWQAVTAMGILVSTLAQTNAESSRTLMRRLMWNLNDESGGIGWGSVEAMGEIMARSALIAAEYAAILISYIRPDGNFLETEGLQQGALWAIGRVAHAHPGLMADAAAFLPGFMSGANPANRGLSAWAAGPIGSAITKPHLAELTRDSRMIEIFIDGSLVKRKVGTLAQEALNLAADSIPPGTG
ncbi:MAG: HEAT repeat domain-containing protein [Pseudomonadota bacterium]